MLFEAKYPGAISRREAAALIRAAALGADRNGDHEQAARWRATARRLENRQGWTGRDHGPGVPPPHSARS